MKIVNSIFACLMLSFMFVLMFFSSWNDSAIMDELAHIPAGYSYLTQNDYRLNPEHPPLIKDLAAVPLLYLGLNFPTNVKAWTSDINGQWDMGRIFLYESGNKADTILHWARFPMMLLAIFFGWLLFKWARKSYGDKVALLTLFFFTMSPTFLAHSRYVTTDVGAAFGFFIGIAAFINFLYRQKTPSALKSLIIAGVVFGIAEMLKFSLVLIAPLYVVFGILWVVLENWHEKKKIAGESLKMMGKIALIGLIGLAVITIVYQFHVWNYPPERQLADTSAILTSFGFRSMANLVIWMADKPILRGLGHYFLGICMTLQREVGGNTAYFLGDVNNVGWRYYFPTLYLFKEQLAFHIFALIALVFSIRNLIKAKEKNLAAAARWMKDNFVLTASIIFIGVYWLQAVNSNLNIGIRHVLPTFPFIYLLVSRQIVRWSKAPTLENPRTLGEWLKNTYGVILKSFKKHLLMWALVLWMILGATITFPYYLSYYNELAGGSRYGYRIAVDSNYDWGQDLKRLNDFVGKSGIGKIAIDYFGGGNPQYYFGDKFEPWWSAKGEPPIGTWFAVSATFLEGALGTPTKGFSIKPEDSFSWLKNKKPLMRAGTSIFIYKF